MCDKCHDVLFNPPSRGELDRQIEAKMKTLGKYEMFGLPIPDSETKGW